MLPKQRGHRSGTIARGIVAIASLAFALVATGCSCQSTMASVDAGPTDAGPLFGGIDAPGYEPRDSGPRPPEPCAVPVRRIGFPVGDESLTWTNQIWAFGSHVWVYLGGFTGALPPSPTESMHLFDLEAERELDIDFAPGEDDDVLGVFEAPAGYEIVVRTGDARPRVVHVGAGSRRTGAADEPLELSAVALERLDDGRYVGMTFHEAVSSPTPATLEIASPSGSVQRIELGFETASGHLTAVRWNGDVLVGIGYENEAARVVRFEVDLDSATVRLATLVEDVRASRGLTFALWSDADTATVALTYVPADDPPGSRGVAELFWWSIGADPVTRQVVRPPADLHAAILALGGDMPRQTLVLGQSSSSRTWATAARVRAPGEVVGGSEPIGVYTGSSAAAAWEPSDGTAAIALLERHELQVLYVCEGAP